MLACLIPLRCFAGFFFVKSAFPKGSSTVMHPAGGGSESTSSLGNSIFGNIFSLILSLFSARARSLLARVRAFFFAQALSVGTV